MLDQQQRQFDVAQITDQILEGGYDAAIHYLRQATQHLVYLIADAKHHRTAYMDGFLIGELGLNDGCPLLAFEGIGSVLQGFAPVISGSSADGLELPNFVTSPEQDEPLSDEETAKCTSELDSVLDAINEAVYRFSMVTDPTAQQIARLYIEMARYENTHRAHGLALEDELIAPAKPRKTAVDHFGVGKQLAVFLSSVLSIRSLPVADQISLPKNPSAEAILSGYFAAVAFMGYQPHYLFRNANYDASGSHRTKNCTLSAGRPYHAPDRLCFDHRLVDDVTSNVQLMKDHLVSQGLPEPAMKFIDTLTEQAQAMEDNEEATPISAMLELICSFADTDSLAMSASQMYLANLFPPPECLHSWRQERTVDL